MLHKRFDRFLEVLTTDTTDLRFVQLRLSHLVRFTAFVYRHIWLLVVHNNPPTKDVAVTISVIVQRSRFSPAVEKFSHDKFNIRICSFESENFGCLVWLDWIVSVSLLWYSDGHAQHEREGDEALFEKFLHDYLNLSTGPLTN